MGLPDRKPFSTMLAFSCNVKFFSKFTRLNKILQDIPLVLPILESLAYMLQNLRSSGVWYCQLLQLTVGGQMPLPELTPLLDTWIWPWNPLDLDIPPPTRCWNCRYWLICSQTESGNRILFFKAHLMKFKLGGYLKFRWMYQLLVDWSWYIYGWTSFQFSISIHIFVN